MQPSFYVVSAILLVCVGNIESTYNTFTYDDGTNNDENCCLVQLGEKFCLAKPLTRSLLQVNKNCQRLGAHEKQADYLSKVVRRLNVEASHKVGDKILIELKTPLEKNILKNDLLCLSSQNNNINLEKCVVEVAPEHHKKHKNKNGSKTNEKTANNTEEQVVVVEETPVEETGVQILELVDPVQVHEGQGLAVHEMYDLNLTNFRVTNDKQRQCWAWYRGITKNLCSHPRRYKSTCVDLTREREKCLEYMFQRKADQDQQATFSRSLTIGSKLYCENSNNEMKLLGYHRHSQICFVTNLQISVQYKFTDFVSLSDVKKNKVLEFMAKNEKFTSEFESDCHDKTTLADVKKSLEKEAETATPVDESPAQE